MHNQKHLTKDEQIGIEYMKLKKNLLCKKQKIDRIQLNIKNIINYINVMQNKNDTSYSNYNKTYSENIIKYHIKCLNDNINLMKDYQEFMDEEERNYNYINNEYFEKCKNIKNEILSISQYLERLKL